MDTPGRMPPPWTKVPVVLQATVAGFFVAAVAANVWPLFLQNLRVMVAAVFEMLFLALFLWWARGGGPPRAARAARAGAFRNVGLTSTQWLWGLIAAFLFAVTVHASIVLLFRFVPYPAEEFRRGYDLSFIPSEPLRWIAVVISAASAAICEETGFRGFMQWPIEQRHGVTVAVLISSFFFTALHLTKAWALLGMIPIVFGAGILLGTLAWSAKSLIPGFIGHFVMDVGLFAYWWTGIAGTFSARTIKQTGIDRPFLIACCTFAASLSFVILSISKLRKSESRAGRGDLL
jgi:membrane protease YdiL (CAAX protease family)